jgi:HB1, ASXL, restriction endonuclease HTH domain
MASMTTKQAIEQVMAGSRKPMKVRAIIDAAVPLPNLKGKTPGQVVYSVLYSENKKPDGLVTQTGKGEFRLNSRRRKADAPKPAAKASAKKAS